MLHEPVMPKQVLEMLSGCPEGVYVDATVGAGGHLLEVFRKFKSKFRYVGFDLDGLILDQTEKLVAEVGLEALLVKANYSTVTENLQKLNISKISASLFDLGIGSYQIDNPERGFSYLEDGPLSMAFNGEREQPVLDLICRLNETELGRLFKQFGQEKKAYKIARAIKDAESSLTSTGQLAGIIRDIVGDRNFIKTASRIFQALRIAVNDEFANIESGLNQAINLTEPGGRIVAITYHSLEDGLVKRIFRRATGKCVCPPKFPECRCGAVAMVKLVNKKPIVADPDEIDSNPRARSAKIRAVEKIETAA